MDLVLVRHGAAEKREAFAATGQPDELRPLTAKGREKLQRAALGLKALVPAVDRIATSRLLRARQTAAILAEVYGAPLPLELPELEPDADCEDVVRWLRAQPRAATLLLVGHEPNLGELVAWLTGRAQAVAMKKGGACRLSLSRGVRKSGATLAWRMAPSDLRSA